MRSTVTAHQPYTRLTPFRLTLYSLEINSSITEIITAYSNVDKWAKPEKPPFSLNFTVMRPVIYKEAKGVVLIISPFNYPLWVTISPLVRNLLLPFFVLFVNKIV